MYIKSRIRNNHQEAVLSILIDTGAKSNLISVSGPRLNIKTVLSTYGDYHVKDKTAVRTSYL